VQRWLHLNVLFIACTIIQFIGAAVFPLGGSGLPIGLVLLQIGLYKVANLVLVIGLAVHVTTLLLFTAGSRFLETWGIRIIGGFSLCVVLTPLIFGLVLLIFGLAAGLSGLTSR